MADGFLLEDGSGRYLLEDGSGVYLNELQTYSLTAETGQFTLTGNAAAFPVSRRITAATGAFTFTGNDAGLTFLPAPTERNYILGGLFPTYVQETGTRDFILAPAYVDGTFPDAVNNYSITAATGTFTLTGNAAGLFAGYPMAAGAGAFVLTGNAAGLTTARKLTAETGAFSLTGNAASLNKGQFLSVDAGAFVLTGNDAALLAGRKISAETGAFVLTGNAVGLVHDYPLSVQTGAFTLTGQAAGLRADRVLTAATGAFTLTGNDADLTYTPNATTREYVLGGLFPVFVQETDDRDYIVSGVFLSETMGQAAAAYSLSVDAGAFTLTGNAAGLYRGLKLATETGAFTLTGNAAGLTRGLSLSAETGVFTLTGNAAALSATTQPEEEQAVGGGGAPLGPTPRVAPRPTKRKEILQPVIRKDEPEPRSADRDDVANVETAAATVADGAVDPQPVLVRPSDEIELPRQIGADHHAGDAVSAEARAAGPGHDELRLVSPPQPERHEAPRADDSRSSEQPAQERAASEESHAAILFDAVTNDNDFMLLAAA
jgi:hypothetical protein